MMFPEGDNGLLLNEEEIQDLRIKRNKTRLPQSLNDLAIQSVYNNFTRFIDVPDSPLKYLPNTIVQQLLSKITSDIEKDKMLMPAPLLMQVLGLLVNPSVTELDCVDFEGEFRDKTLSNYLATHALENCPKIKKIILNNDLSKDLKIHHFCLFECFKKSWNNLTTIKIFEIDYRFNEYDIMSLQENFPNIEDLTVPLFIQDYPKDVPYYFVDMKRLHTLYFFGVAIHDYYFCESALSEFIVDVAGRAPSLRNFGFDLLNDRKDYGAEFIDMFGEKYPHKKLLVDRLSTQSGLKRKWPKNLSVKHLTIHGYWSEIEIENLSTIEFTLDLTVNCKLAQQMYQVLDCIGGLVKSLSIDDRPGEMNVEFDTEFILERVLAACPNLEHFKYKTSTSMSVVRDPKYNLPPAAFKNYKSFTFNGPQYNYVEEVVLQKVYRKFLIGTEVCESLEHLNYEQLETLAQVALEYPKSMQQLRELNCYSFFHDEMNVAFAFDKYDKCFYVLLTSCHKLERIFFCVHGERLSREVAPVNRYLATIQSIDPHFIQKYS